MRKQNSEVKHSNDGGFPQGPDRGFLHRRQEVYVILFLFLSIGLIYWQVLGFDFISFDDPQFVSENAQVQRGLSLENLLWAFTLHKPGDLGYWYPLTWISHMTDCQLFGLNPGLHHLSNVFYHILNSILLFVAFRLMTGSLWRSAFVASLFALHPINVDSAAWIAERKNLLSTTFWLLTMIAYFSYTRRKNIALYLVTFAMLCLGSLAKPMLVTLPFVLLLLDYWPLERVRVPRWRDHRDQWKAFYKTASRLVLEKIPLIATSMVFVYINVYILSANYFSALDPSHLTPMDLKVKNAIVSYMAYLGKMFWPAGLSIFHPYPESVPWWQVIGSSAALIAITAVILVRLRRYPYLSVGWLWFLGTLVPVLGIVQAGLWPAIGERWAYVPFIGLFVMVSWAGGDIFSRFSGRKILPAVAAAVVLTALSLQTWTQLGHWKDDFSVFSHSLRIDKDNYVGHVNLAAAYAKNREYEQARYHFQEALRIHATDVLALEGLGRLHKILGQYDKSRFYYSEIIKYNPRNMKAYLELGSVLTSEGDLEGARRQYEHAAKLDPGYAPAYYSLGVISAQNRELDKAVEYFSTAIRLDPQDIDSHCSIGVVLMNQGRVEEAKDHFKQALRIDPGSQQAASYLSSVDFVQKVNQDIGSLEKERAQKPNNSEVYQKLAVLYAGKGDYTKALDMLERLARLRPGDPHVDYNMACIHAKQGRTDLAMSMLKKSIDKGFKDWELLKRDKDLDSLRATRMYRDLMQDK